MTFVEVLESLSYEDKEHIGKVLATFSSCTALCLRLRSNLDSESRLIDEAWKGLLGALLPLKVEDDPSLVQKAIIESLRPWVLQGPQLIALRPTYLGRAVTIDYFCRFLVDSGHFGSIKSAKRNVRNLLLKPKEVTARRWQNYPLGKYLLWSTFSIEGNPQNPFDGLPSSADGIRGVLGLDPNEKGKALLLLAYTLPPSVVPLFPTIAEAYAGDRWNYFFTPAPKGATHGMTLPWPEYEDYAPRPEVVHKIVFGERLSSPIKRVS